MKSLTSWALTGAALLMLTIPMTAQAQELGRGAFRHGYACAWRHRDIAWDRHNLRGQRADIGRDRFALRQDIANGNWGAAQAERDDIRRDFMNVRRQRRDLYRDYRGMPGPGPEVGYMPLSNFGAVPRTNYMPPAAYVPPFNSAYVPGRYAAYPASYYGNTAAPYYPAAPSNYAGLNGQGLGGLLGNILP
jgi:hypothetical protein